MGTSEKSYVNIIGWKNIKDTIHKLNPELYRVIADIAPDDKFKLIEAEYHYGDYIIENGRFLLPLEAKDSIELLQLDYAPIPLFLVLHNNTELCIQSNDNVLPLNICSPGSLLGLYETTDYLLEKKSHPRWTVTAGARSIFTLPKLSDIKGHLKLGREFNFPTYLSRTSKTTLSDHWEIFKNIANYKRHEDQWTVRVLFFPKQWLEYKHDKNPAWIKFYRFLFEQSVASVSLAPDKLELDLAWTEIAKTIEKTKTKPGHLVIDTIKHLMGIERGHFPAFRPASDQSSAPIQLIQEALLEVYKLREYYPTIMHPVGVGSFKTSKQALYYSLSYPTLISGLSYDSLSHSIMDNMKLIKYIIEQATKMPNTTIQEKDFTFYHYNTDIDHDIEMSTAVPKLDKAFVDFDTDKYKFCYSSQFWRGCIKVT